MSIVLEEINPIEAPSDTPVSTIVTESQASEPPGLSEDSVTATAAEAQVEAAIAAPKKRGRPKKEAVATEEAITPVTKAVTKAATPKTKAKAAPKKMKPPPIIEEESSDEDVDETLRNVYNHVAKPDMETAILQFLVNRKQTETQRRRTLWSQLAQM